jgi:N-acetylmuramoyl-L-alanine amidase
MSLSYSAHVENSGWMPDVGNGAIAGTTGQSRRIEALKINLTGDFASFFTLYYRVHSASYGWFDWAKSGDWAGTVGRGLRVEALELRLVPYGGSVPGSTLRPHLFSKIYLDAGHGPDGTGNGLFDQGASGNGYTEFQLTSELVTLVTHYARSIYGLDIYPNTAGGDYRLRQPQAVTNDCSSIVSIHFNSVGVRGFESYIHSEHPPVGSGILQAIMHESLQRAYGLSTPNRGMKTMELAICGGPLPATLLEVAFIDNSVDMINYQIKKDTIARELAYGLYLAERAGY